MDIVVLKQIIHNWKAILGLLSRKEQTGYDLYLIFQEQIIYFWNSSHSQTD